MHNTTTNTTTLRAVLIGYGKMGRTLHTLLNKEGHQVVATIHRRNKHQYTPEKLKALQANIAFEFTEGNSALENIQWAWQANLPVVSGTTGWTPPPQLSSTCQQQKTRLLYSPNFSVGILLLRRAIQMIARLLPQSYNARWQIQEWHHKHKKDAPSGTAQWLASTLIQHSQNLTHWQAIPENEPLPKPLPPHTLPILWYRENEIFGIHEVTLLGSEEKLILRHEAHNRTLFAHGALLAALWLLNQPPGFYTFEDVFNNPQTPA